MLKSNKYKIPFFSILAIILFMSLQISISPDSSFNIENMFSTSEATIPCSDKRCDNVFGEDYGCRLMNPDTNCEYSGSSCVGYKPCSSSVNPEEN